MAILHSYPFDGTPGATVTAANSGFVSITGTMVFNTAGTAIEIASGATAYGEDQTVGDYCAIWLSVPALPTGTDECVAAAMNGATTLAAVRVRTTGAISIYSGLGTLVATTTATITAGTEYRLEWNTRTDGQELRLYTAGGSTPVETITGTVAAASATTKRRLGHPQTAQAAGVVDLFQATINDAWPNASNSAPVANAGPDQTNVAADQIVTLNGSGSNDPDAGDTITYAWTQTAGTTVTLSSTTAAQPTFTAPSTGSAQTLTFSLIVTDSHGATSAPDTVNISVLAAAPTSNLKIRIGGVAVPAVRRVRINGIGVPVTTSIATSAPAGDASVFSDTYTGTY